jgi:hypothetical protein
VPSVPEIRNLLAKLLLRLPKGKSFAFAWLLWRRRHQLAAAQAHYNLQKKQL